MNLITKNFFVRSIIIKIFHFAFSGLLILLPVYTAQSKSIFDDFKDPTDDAFDMSHFLAEKKGFMPVPIIVTEPAIGFGLGAAALFLHDPLSGKTPEGETFDPQNVDKEGKLIPPSMSVAAGAYTENDSWFAGGGHMGVWQNGDLRYTGGLAKVSLNLKFFGLGKLGEAFPDKYIGFNIESWIFLQELKHRIGQSDFFGGIDYFFMDADTEFDLSDLPIPGDPTGANNSRSAAIGLFVDYDSRDSTFTPSKGMLAEVKGSFYREAVGSDNNFNKYRAFINYFFGLSRSVVLGLRADGEALDGDQAPFYEYPFINMRGIPAMRYQGEETILGEAEVRWNFTPRWSIIAFGGAGKAVGIDETFSSTDTIYSKGLGFRYMIARRFKMHVGLDVAKGPEETAVYIQVGSAWGR